jgi:hypothetical protein
MVLVELNSSAIMVEANCTSSEMIHAYQHLIDHLKTAGIEPQWHVLNNECPAEFKDTIKKNSMTFQLVPPHDHRQKKCREGNPDLQGTLYCNTVWHGQVVPAPLVVPAPTSS